MGNFQGLRNGLGFARRLCFDSRGGLDGGLEPYCVAGGSACRRRPSAGSLLGVTGVIMLSPGGGGRCRPGVS